MTLAARLHCIALPLLFPLCGGAMSTQVLEELPAVPQSPAEILAATHAVLAELVQVTPGQWKREGPVERRQLSLRVRLVRRLKGPLALAEGAEADVAVQQEREDAWQVNEFHGVWSHLEPAPGLRWLFLASSTSPDLAVVLQNEALLGRGAWPADHVVDLETALAAERAFDREMSNPDGGPPEDRLENALRAALAAAAGPAARLHDLFSNWLRVRASGPLTGLRHPPVDAAAALLAAGKDPSFKLGVARLLSDAARDKASLVRPVCAALARALADEGTPAPTRQRIAEVALVPLLDARAPAPDVLEAAERTRAAKAAAALPGEGAARVRAWLERAR